MLVGNLQQRVPYGPPLLFGETRKFRNDLRRTHGENLTGSPMIARLFSYRSQQERMASALKILTEGVSELQTRSQIKRQVSVQSQLQPTAF